MTIGMMMNNQILKYGGTTELAVFGVISTLMALFQALFAGVGQAIQPIVSTNYGAGNGERVKAVWRLALATVLLLGLAFMGFGELFPLPVTKFFMTATPKVLIAAPKIFRLFFPMFLGLGVTVLSDYYLQSIMEMKMSMVIGLSHSIFISGAVIFLLPLLWAMDGVWLALSVAEALIASFGAWYIMAQVNRKQL